MKIINLIFGVSLLIVFLITGWYMKEVLKSEHLLDSTVRMELRANHIYILFISLLNMLSFKVNLSESTISKYCNLIFRFLLVFAGLLAIAAFIYDHSGILEERINTFYQILFSLVAIGAVAVNELSLLIKEK
ncbi:hypothetical protein [Reichenbachiella sp. MALMAid0571]|uniref:hypothetical protein n=1 Tax=Reichenbachiella sp. MALMAid0571 TaxID=3143939 RepID=UPI0032DF7C4F